jgi:hypothetical protein
VRDDRAPEVDGLAARADHGEFDRRTHLDY